MKATDPAEQLLADERGRSGGYGLEEWHKQLYDGSNNNPVNPESRRSNTTAISTMELREKQCFGIMGTLVRAEDGDLWQDAMPIEFRWGGRNNDPTAELNDPMRKTKPCIGGEDADFEAWAKRTLQEDRCDMRRLHLATRSCCPSDDEDRVRRCRHRL